MEINEEELKEELIKRYKNIYDPEIPANIFDLGLIYSVEFEKKENCLYATVEMTLTSPACPVAESLVEQVKHATLDVCQIDQAEIRLVFDPPWDLNMMSEEAKEIMKVSGAAF